tara:strand:- start:146 stop:1027 length:882 start_codon:yes stop_codon:yes gene_type:complete
MNIPIFLSSDDNYASFVASTIASICDNTKSFVDIYVLDGGITFENKEKILKLKEKFKNFSIEFISVDLEKEFKGFSITKMLPKAAYSRFLISELKPELNRALYLDVDIIVVGDIEELWNETLDDKTIGWIEDSAVSEIVDDIKFKFNINNYFNSGVILINLDQWRKNQYTNKLFELEVDVRDKLVMPDQDLLNMVFSEDHKSLDAKFNVQYDADNIVIRHYVNVFKPWRFNYFKVGNQIKPLSKFDDFWRYIKLTDFYDEVLKSYNESINSNLLTKRMSIIAEKMKMESKNDK